MLPRRLLLAGALSLLATFTLEAQQEDTTSVIDLGGESVQVVGEQDGVVVFWGYGSRPRRLSSAPAPRWYMVQDSSLGVVFKEPSGLKVDSDGGFNGDIDVRALQEIHALEIRALTFNVWNEYAGGYRVTYQRIMDPGDENGFDPSWYDFRNESQKHLISLVYVSRVRLADGTIVKADTEPLETTARSIDPEYESTTSEQNLDDLLRLWREFLRQLRGVGGLPGMDQAMLPGGGVS